jgi:pyrimidine-nucleoside phosphorylase
MRLFTDMIADKRDGRVLTGGDIRGFLNAFMSGEVADYQMSAMLMAVCIRGLDGEELASWTDAMLHSGKVLEHAGGKGRGPVVDKHSTGGVGDKVSIPLAPALASLGLRVPMVSGRGLGHTGGTLDKLESIPGFNVNLGLEASLKQLDKTGCFLIGQTAEIAPLDKRLYSLRDVTGTVESIPLIASSIMSKKLAEGVEALVLDVKVGSGAFMKDLSSAKLLGMTMKKIGESLGKSVSVGLTNMDEPLGYKCGNALEIEESVDVLRGRNVPQVTELVEMEGGVLLAMTGMAKDLGDGIRKMHEVLQNGKAMEKFVEIVQAQSGDPEAVLNPLKLPKAKMKVDIKSERAGFVSRLDALAFGKALVVLEGGRKKVADRIDPSVGFVFYKKVGDPVDAGEPVYGIQYNKEERLEEARMYLNDGLGITESRVKPTRLILGDI